MTPSLESADVPAGLAADGADVFQNVNQSIKKNSAEKRSPPTATSSRR
jgi:hypothetical protein